MQNYTHEPTDARSNRMRKLNSTHQSIRILIEKIERKQKNDPSLPRLCKLIDRVNAEKLRLSKEVGHADE